MTEPLPSQVGIDPRFPIEVWEHVIDAVYDDRHDELPIAVATLSSCALVCRAWHPRAQQVLFDYVLLRDQNALYRFAELVDASPKLGSYVRRLAIRGYLHVPYSPAVLFLTALRGRLTNLSALAIHGFEDGEKAANSLPEGEKELPCLPFHRYFPSLLTSISHIRRLSIRDVRFTSFGDFARFLSALRNLGELYCTRISWGVLGVEPACLARGSSFNSGETFLPNLNTLACYYMEEEGKQRLVSALGPSLRTLWNKFPDSSPTVRAKHPDIGPEAPSLALDLSSLPCLSRLFCLFEPFAQPDEHLLESLQDTLASWVLECGDGLGDVSPFQRCLYLRPWDREAFTREQFVELLRRIGPIIEGALCRRKLAGVDLGYQAGEDNGDLPESDPTMAKLVMQGIGDRPEWEEWWRTAIAACFPTLSRWNRLEIYPSHATFLCEHWRDYDQIPQENADRSQSALRSRRRRKQMMMHKFIATRGALVRRRQRQKHN